MKNVIILFAKSFLIPLGLMAEGSVAKTGIKKKKNWLKNNNINLQH